MIKKIPEIDISKVKGGKTVQQIAKEIESSVVFNNAVLESVSNVAKGINSLIDGLNKLDPKLSNAISSIEIPAYYDDSKIVSELKELTKKLSDKSDQEKVEGIISELSSKVETLTKTLNSNREETCREVNLLSNSLTRTTNKVESLGESLTKTSSKVDKIQGMFGAIGEDK